MNFFDEIEEQFKHEFQKMLRMFTNTSFPNAPMQPEIEERDGVRIQRWGPIVYGRSTTIGPDGKVHTQEWGNLTPEMREQFEDQTEEPPFTFTFPPTPQERRPSPIPDPLTPDQPFPVPQRNLQPKEEDYLIEILDTEDGYTAIFDTPAIDRNEVEAHVDGHRLELWIQNKIFRELELPNPVTLSSLNFKNGVVELQLRSKKPE